MVGMGDVTQILSKIEYGDPSAAEQLLPLIYDELRALAAAKMADESPNNTLQATALVHEAYIRLVDVDEAQNWNSRGHFFGAAAEAMRRIVVEGARRKCRLKHGGEQKRLDMQDLDIAVEEQSGDILALDDALSNLARRHPLEAEFVKLRYFCGLTVGEATESMGISSATADRKWAYAKAWLYRELAPEGTL